MDSDLPEWANKQDSRTRSLSRITALSSLTGIVKIAVAVSIAIIMARLLPPQDFGIVAMVMPVVAIAMLLANMGFNEFILQMEEVTSDVLNSMFWTACLTSVVTYGLVIGYFQVIADHPPGLHLGLLAAFGALALLSGPVTTIHGNLARRFARQDLTTLADSISAVTSLVIGIALALTGWGFWALLMIPLTRQLMTAAILWSLIEWRPGMPSIKPDVIRSLIPYLGWSVAALLVALSRQVDKLFLGAERGILELGYYSIAYAMAMVPLINMTSPLAGAAIPFLSDAKDDPQLLQRSVCRILIGLCALFSILIWTSVESESIILIALGENWRAAAVLFETLSLFILTLILQLPFSWLLTSTGQIRRASLWHAAFSLTIVLAVWLGAARGAETVAYYQLIVGMAGLIVLPLFMGNVLGVSAMWAYRIIGKLVLLLVAVYFAVAWVSGAASAHGPLAQLLASLVSHVLLVACAMLIVLRRDWAD